MFPNAAHALSARWPRLYRWLCQVSRRPCRGLLIDYSLSDGTVVAIPQCSSSHAKLSWHDLPFFPGSVGNNWDRCRKVRFSAVLRNRMPFKAARGYLEIIKETDEDLGGGVDGGAHVEEETDQDSTDTVQRTVRDLDSILHLPVATCRNDLLQRHILTRMPMAPCVPLFPTYLHKILELLMYLLPRLTLQAS